jgi:hypothetical protein
MKKILLSFVSFALAFSNVNAQLASGDYLIQNVESGQYLGGGHDWGTHASLISKPQFFTVTLNNGKYSLDSHQSNGGDSHYLSTNLYLDQTYTEWEIKEVSDGIYVICLDGGFLNSQGVNSEVNVVTNPSSKSTYWKFVSMDDIVASMANATSANPVDVTAFIKNPELKRNYPNAWTVTAYNGYDEATHYQEGYDKAWANCSQSNHSSNGFKTVQTITLAKAGKYTLSAQAFYRQDGGNEPLPYLFAGDQKSEFPVLTGSENDMVSAYASFLNKAYTVEPIEILTKEDEQTIEIGFAGEALATWNIFGELELKYYGAITDDYILNSAKEKFLNLISEANNIYKNSSKEPLDKNVLYELQRIATYYANSTKTTKEDYDQAYEEVKSIVDEAKASIAFYKEVKTYVDKAENLDEAGKAVFEDMKKAYDDCVIENLDDVKTTYIAAVKAQNTDGADMTDVMPATWEGQTGTYSGSYPETYTEYSFEPGKIIYQRIEGLTPGIYEVQFIASASLTDWRSTQIGEGAGIAQVYLNEAAYDIEVIKQNACNPEDYACAYRAEVGEDGVLEYGIQNIANGGSWYVAKAISLTYHVKEKPNAINVVETSTVATGKFFDNGQVVIVKNGAKFNVNGVRK